MHTVSVLPCEAMRGLVQVLGGDQVVDTLLDLPAGTVQHFIDEGTCFPTWVLDEMIVAFEQSAPGERPCFLGTGTAERKDPAGI